MSVTTSSSTPGWRHAVVVGGGFGGLLAARVLSDHFDRVSVLEQDPVTADTEYRSGVPQARHSHVLLARGASIAEELFPGLRAELAERGAPIFDLGESARIRFPTGWAPRSAIGLPTQSFTRVALEGCIRRRVLAHSGITVRGGFRVENLCWDATRSRVTGVRGRPRTTPRMTPSPPGPVETIDADLVIDASGRTSTLPRWLSEADFPPPRDRVVDGNLSYTSRLYHIPPDSDTDWAMTGEITYAPTARRGGIITTVEARRWLVTCVGAGGEATPTDEAGFLAYARSLRNPHVAASITDAAPAGPLYRVVKLTNRWTLYHRMRRWPDRLLCLGDVVCALNPVYGQGMTLAAIQATILRDLLDRRHHRGNLTGLARQFHRRTARSLHLPWLMATSSDLAWNLDNTPLSARLAHWYFDRLLELLPTDVDIFRRFFSTAQMVTSPMVLLHPRILGRVARLSLHRRITRRQPTDGRSPQPDTATAPHGDQRPR